MLAFTKTDKPRTILIDYITVGVLTEWRKLQKHEYLNVNELIQLFQVEKWMYRVQEKHTFKKVTPHGLRHTHCSLFEAGATIKEVQDRLGHTDVKTTMDIYTHVTQKAKEGAIQKFVNYLES